MYSNFIGPTTRIDHIRNDLLTLIYGGLILTPFAYKLFPLLNQEYNLSVNILIVIYLSASYIVSIILNSLKAIMEHIIDRIQIIKIMISSDTSGSMGRFVNLFTIYQEASKQFHSNWNTYLCMKFDKHTQPVGQKYISDLVSTFILEMSTSICFFILTIEVWFLLETSSWWEVGLSILPCFFGILHHILRLDQNTNKIDHLMLFLILFFLTVLLIYFSWNVFSSIEVALFAISAFLFNLSFILSLRSSWSLYNIREILIKDQPA